MDQRAPGPAQFRRPRQPHVPGELGYYDLTDPAMRERAGALARAHGVDAFCYYHYWFGGRRLLERPFDAVLASGRPDFPFCVCWANENWTRRWDGLDHEVLMAQRYSRGRPRRFMERPAPGVPRPPLPARERPPAAFWSTSRDIPEMADTRAAGARPASRRGRRSLSGARSSAMPSTTRRPGLDAACEFPPIGHAAENITARMPSTQSRLPRQRVRLPQPRRATTCCTRARAFRQFRGITPMWDNTARRPNDGMIVARTPRRRPSASGWSMRWPRRGRATPETSACCSSTRGTSGRRATTSSPMRSHGRRYLAALARRAPLERRRAVRRRPSLAEMVGRARQTVEARRYPRRPRASGRSARPGPDGTISVVMPVFNHARFLDLHRWRRDRRADPPAGRAGRRRRRLGDGSADLVAAFGDAHRCRSSSSARRTPAPTVALNRGLALARGSHHRAAQLGRLLRPGAA